MANVLVCCGVLPQARKDLRLVEELIRHVKRNNSAFFDADGGFIHMELSRVKLYDFVRELNFLKGFHP